METAVIEKKSVIRGEIIKAEMALRTLPGALIGDSPEYLALCPLKHSFADGMYIREIFLPEGMLFVTKIHKKLHPYFMLKGDCSVLTENGVVRIKAPFSGLTPAGTKRVIYAHEDTIWITVHATLETDIDKIENEVIAKSFKEMGLEVEGIEEKELLDFYNTVKEKE
jgi:hypothetical protein